MAVLIRVAAVAVMVSSAAFAPVAGQISQDQALALAFSDADVERRTAYLDDDQLDEARRLAGGRVEIESTIVTHYIAHRTGNPVGVAYFDAHRVRTLQQVLMIVVQPDGSIGRVETVSFREPPEYEAPGGWLDLFDGRVLDDRLSTRGQIPNVTGATLTSNAVTAAVRRVLALHAVIRPFASGSP
ncbi:MAG: FMN-binding protein [Gemmatimonadota bacterium]|nr:FMN-binding protein [Gemmatimonadota bacterium]MDE3004504.1 FMN-binding protein [Gemmatimonadota bacterium]MDE3012831.1 FMN-binding protein [Gemmatimonadota bacterium]